MCSAFTWINDICRQTPTYSSASQQHNPAPRWSPCSTLLRRSVSLDLVFCSRSTHRVWSLFTKSIVRCKQILKREMFEGTRWKYFSCTSSLTYVTVHEAPYTSQVMDYTLDRGPYRLRTKMRKSEIPQRAAGSWNRRIPGIPQILPESRSTEIQRWAIICGTKFCVLKISNNLDTNLPWQKSFVFFVKAGLYPNYLISSKQKTWCHKLLLISEFPNFGIQEASLEFLEFVNSDIPQPTVGFPHFRLKSLGLPVGNSRWDLASVRCSRG